MAASFSSTSLPAPKTEFERQRGELIQEIAESFEHVLANINKLNRNLEAVITVGNEFSSVEALWSTFENVMGKPVPTTGDNKTAAAAATATAEDDDEQGEVEQQQGQQRQGTPGKRKRGNDAGGDREGQNEEKDL